MSFETYAHIDRLGHRNTDGILDTAVRVQEKVDGSQFSFGTVGGSKDSTGGLVFRSRRHGLDHTTTDQLFSSSVEHIKSVRNRLVSNWIYRAEAMRNTKPNVLTYERVPDGFTVLYDIETEPGQFASQATIEMEAEALEIDVVPEFGRGLMALHTLRTYLEYPSFLGGRLEGVVIKSLDQIDRHTGRLRMAKLIGSAMTEVRGDKPPKFVTGREPVEVLLATFATEARWISAVKHLNEAGELTGSMKDIGPILKELATDLWSEEADTMGAILLKYFEKDIRRGLAKGFPEWYEHEMFPEEEGVPDATQESYSA